MPKDMADALMARDDYGLPVSSDDDPDAKNRQEIVTQSLAGMPPDPATDAAIGQSDKGHYERAIKQLEQSNTRIEDLYKQRGKAVEPIQEDLETMAGAAPTPVPKIGKELEEQPKPPNPREMMRQFQEDTNGIMVGFSALAMFGAMRNGPTAALSFLGGAFKGLQEGQAEQAAQAWKQFEAETNRVVQKNKDIMGEYRATLESKKLDFDQKVELMKVTASKYDDRIAHEMLERKDFVTMEQLFAKRDAANIQVQKYLLALQTAKAKAEAAAGGGKDALSLDQAKQRVERWLGGGPNPGTNLGRGALAATNQKILEQAMGVVAQEHGWSQQQMALHTRQLQAELAAEKSSFINEQKIGTAIVEMKKSIPKAKEALAKLPRQQLLKWNEAREAYENQTGDIKLANASLWVQEVIKLYSITLARGGAGAVDLRADANKLLATKNSPGAASATLDSMMEAANIALESPPVAREKMRESIGTGPMQGGATNKGAAPADDPLGILH